MKIKIVRVYIIIGILTALGIAASGIFIIYKMKSNLNILMDMPLSKFNSKELNDGEYSGAFKHFPVSAEVLVTVKNNKITDIRLEKHIHGQGSEAEVITERVVAEQSLDVDLISGATFSSKVILKAIESALNTALIQ